MAAAVASGIPGPIGAVAQIISAKLGKDVKPDADSISAAIAGATPDQILKLKEDDQNFQVTIQKMGFEHDEDLANAAYADRANARAREVSIRDRMPAILGISVTVGFFGLVGLLAFHAFPEATKDTLLLLIGALTVGWKDVMGYYFGSSAGSQQKDATIANLSK